jgi:arsenate reductase
LDTIIYHNPRCSKSRETLALLRAHGVEPTLIEYLETPPDEATVRKLLQALHLSVREIVRRKEPVFRELGLADADDDALIAAICTHPVLLERPIVVRGRRAALGRPPENVLTLLS